MYMLRTPWSAAALAASLFATAGCDHQPSDPTQDSPDDYAERGLPPPVPSAPSPQTTPPVEGKTADNRTALPDAPAPHGEPMHAEADEAEAELKAAPGEGVDADVDLYATAEGVRVVVEVDDAKPGKHGIHIHEKGDCSDIEGKSMGGHLAPDEQAHALPAEGAGHLGDMGNLEVDAEGDARFDFIVKEANLKPGDENSLLGKAVVLHSGKDSGKGKQPSGDSGKPIACGVIEKDD